MATPTDRCTHGIPPHEFCTDCYRDRVWELEQEGMTTSDAQGIADLEVAGAGRWAERQGER
jgi:hypothetical protein